MVPGTAAAQRPVAAGLVDRLDGHPRAVEFANDLIQDALSRWGRRYGEWRLPDRPTREDVAKEWNQLVEPALPKVQQKLRDDLLFDAIWDHVLDDRARRMLYRMTLLRRPWEWDLMRELGEPERAARGRRGDGRAAPEHLAAGAGRSARVGSDGRPGLVPHYTLHPATAQFIARRFGDDAPLRLDTHRRVGTYLEAQAAASPYIETDIEAGHHLFQAGEYDRSYELLGSASRVAARSWPSPRGSESPGAVPGRGGPPAMRPELVGRLLGTLGLAYYRLGQVERAIGFYEQRLAIAREIGDRRGEGTALGNLGIAYADLGQVERAIGFYEQHLAIAREIGDRRGEGNTLGNLGLAYADLGQVERAIDFYEQALAIAREIGDRRGEGNALGNLGNAYADLGQVERAIGFYEQAPGDRARDRRPPGRGERPRQPGPRLRRPGPGGAGHRLLRAGTWSIAREIGDRRGEGNALGNLGIAYADLGQVERAIGFYEQDLVDRARDRRPPGRGDRPRQPGPRLRRPGPGGAGHRPARTSASDWAGDQGPANHPDRIPEPGTMAWRFRVGMIRHADLGRTCWNVSASSRR